ncbi:MAG: hypothetical protein OJF51_000375 [Nitrospira sp.]|nr:MAG: hypothetical protein OJF51_000375 [Nitrospira sp.]
MNVHLRDQEIECPFSTHLIDESASCTAHAVGLARSAEVASLMVIN